MRKVVLTSNWWPLLAYLVAIFWLIVVNHPFLGLNFNFTPESYVSLAQLDSIVHFMVALSIASLLAQVMSRGGAICMVLSLAIAWEIFEVIGIIYVAPNLFTQPGRAGQVGLVYLFDTLDDLALVISGSLTGAFLTERPTKA